MVVQATKAAPRWHPSPVSPIPVLLLFVPPVWLTSLQSPPVSQPGSPTRQMHHLVPAHSYPTLQQSQRAPARRQESPQESALPGYLAADHRCLLPASPSPALLLFVPPVWSISLPSPPVSQPGSLTKQMHHLVPARLCRALPHSLQVVLLESVQ